MIANVVSQAACDCPIETLKRLSIQISRSYRTWSIFAYITFSI